MNGILPVSLLLSIASLSLRFAYFSLSARTYLQQLTIREFSFHHLNANLLWPGTFAFAQWLLLHPSFLHARRVLELGSATGALAIFLTKSLQLDITTSDYDDQQIEQNIAYNCTSNALPPLPHIRRKLLSLYSPIPSRYSSFYTV